MESNRMPSKKIADDSPSLIWAVIGITTIIILIYVAKFWDREFSFNTQDWGGFGSFLGGTIGVFFTAGSLIYLSKTLHFERNKANQENFDNRFFLMLEVAENIKNKISENKKNELLLKINDLEKFTLEDTLVSSKKIIHKFNSDFGHYYRMLYQILKMINKYEKDFLISEVEISYYTNILRSTLDFKLTQILAINIYHSTSFDKAYKEYSLYCREYDFFQHMPFSIVNHQISESLIALYLNDQTGFWDSDFVGNLNKNFIELAKESVELKLEYDLLDFFLNNILGSWSSEDNKIQFNISENELFLVTDQINVKLDLDRYLPDDSGMKVKLYSMEQNGFEIKLFFDENLNLNIDISEDQKVHGINSKFTQIVLIYISKEKIKISIDSRFHNFSDINYISMDIPLEKNKL